MIASPEVAPPPSSYSDRVGGLIAFGVLELLLSALFLGFVGLLAVSLRLRPANLPPGYPPPNLVPAVAVYGGLAIVFAWLGVGSILARRWARALSATLGWIWLAVGALGGVFLLVLLPRMLEVMPGLPPGTRVGAFGCVAVVWTLCLVLLPLGLALFYSSDNVRRTCEARDPRPRWTDRCPVPVLILVVMSAFGAVALAFSSLHPVFPFFGRSLTGPVAAVAFLVLAGCEALLGWGFYQLKPAAWWGRLGLTLFTSLSTAVTFYRGIDWALALRASGQPDTPMVHQMLDAMFRGPFFLGAAAVAGMGFVVYMLWIRRYFVPRPA